MKSCFGRIVTLGVLVGVAYAGFRWGPAVFPPLERWLRIGGDAAAADRLPSQEVADQTLQRWERFRSHAGSGDRMTLDQIEVASVIRYSLPGRLPPGVSQPSVELEDGALTLSARFALDAFPRFPDLKSVLDILPDTVPLELHASLLPFGDRETALVVRRIDASRIPLPHRYVPDILEALGRSDRDGLPADALAVPLPPGLRAAYVEGDSLVLVAEG